MSVLILLFQKYQSYIGTLLGALGGFLYYFFVGCTGGSCKIWSSPYISTIYGALMGYLLFSSFKKEEKNGNF
jgi:hypothetical protein